MPELKQEHGKHGRIRAFCVIQSTNSVLIRFIILYSSRLCLVISLILPDIWHGRTVIKPIEKFIFVCDFPSCVRCLVNKQTLVLFNFDSSNYEA